MAFASREAQLAYQAEWKRKKRRIDPAYREREKLWRSNRDRSLEKSAESRFYRNDRNWRFHTMEKKLRDALTDDLIYGLTKMSANQLASPLFLVYINGQWKRESLTEPLPKW